MADILIVDDDASVAGALRRFLESEGHEFRVASNAADGVRLIGERRPDLVVMDIRMPGVDGLAALDQVQARFPGVCVAMMTGYGTSQTSIDAMKAGAFDYITKPPDLDELRRLIARATAATRPVGEDAAVSEAAAPSLIGETPAMLELYKMIGRLAKNDVPALFTGEPGTGKSLAIAMLHDNSNRRGEPLLRVDCTLPGAACEDVLFGAATGTIQLVSVEVVPAALQARLARALSDGTRAQSTERVRARLVASTSADLVGAVAAGTFNRDLYDAISLITIHMPPLRQRRDDLPLLIRHVIGSINGKLNRAIKGVDDRAATRLYEHAWPGNVAELERVLTRAAILTGGEIMTSDDIAFLTDSVFHAGTDGAASLERVVRAALHERLVESPAHGGLSMYHEIVDAVETALVKEALTITKGNQVKASELLGLNRATLRKKAPAE